MIYPQPTAVDPIFAALANPTRRELLRLLRDEGRQPVQQLADHFDMQRPSVSEHLKALLDAGLVREQKEGRQRFYHLEAAPLQALQAWLAPYEQFWREKMNNLHTVLQEEHDPHE
jgi:DNA-binding transcriptional ArsR family regulator